ncbi:MAG: hypothetical protein EOO38_19640 [Cytophagaceae bacterium]|nr:MAG: hypothetical protein EOO38_19640 [Cytophagaceae bacterium]
MKTLLALYNSQPSMTFSLAVARIVACSALLQGRSGLHQCGEQVALSGSMSADMSASSSRDCYTPVSDRYGRAADASVSTRPMQLHSPAESMQHRQRHIPGPYRSTRHLYDFAILKQYGAHRSK